MSYPEITTNILKVKRLGNYLIFTEEIKSDNKTIKFVNRVIDFTLETEVYKNTWLTKMRAFQDLQKCIKEFQDESSGIEINKQLCVLCGAMMELKHGMYGPFYSCIRWPDCKCTVDTKGKLSKQSKILLKYKKKTVKKQIEKPNKIDSIQTRIENLDLS